MTMIMIMMTRTTMVAA